MDNNVTGNDRRSRFKLPKRLLSLTLSLVLALSTFTIYSASNATEVLAAAPTTAAQVLSTGTANEGTLNYKTPPNTFSDELGGKSGYGTYGNFDVTTPNPGAIGIDKRITNFDAATGIATIQLGVKGVPKPVPSYTTIVMDCSGSMQGTALTNAKAGAKQLAQEMLNTPGNYVAVYYFTGNKWYQAIDFSNSYSNVAAKIDTMSANGTTFTQGGLYGARKGINEAIASNNETKYPKVKEAYHNVVLISDGAANRYRSWSGAYSYNGGDANSDGETNGQLAAVNEANLLKALNASGTLKDRLQVISIGYGVSGSDGTKLQALASSPSLYYTGNSANIEKLLFAISKLIPPCGTDAVIKDTIGANFQLVGNVTSIVPTPAVGAITMSGKEITWNLGLIPKSGAFIEYKVKINDDASAGNLYTNDSAVLTYKDINGSAVTMNFRKPQINKTVTVLGKDVYDKDGNKIPTASSPGPFKFTVDSSVTSDKDVNTLDLKSQEKQTYNFYELVKYNQRPLGLDRSLTITESAVTDYELTGYTISTNVTETEKNKIFKIPHGAASTITCNNGTSAPVVTVVKSFENSPSTADKAQKFPIVFTPASGTPITLNVSADDGTTITTNNLSVGTVYTLSETPVAGYSFKEFIVTGTPTSGYTWNPQTKQLKITDKKAKITIECVNRVAKGIILVDKLLDENDAKLYPSKQFTLRLTPQTGTTLPSGTYRDITFSYNVSGSITDLPYGTYLVEELADSAFSIEGITVTPTDAYNPNTKILTVNSNTSITIRCENKSKTVETDFSKDVLNDDIIPGTQSETGAKDEKFTIVLTSTVNSSVKHTVTVSENSPVDDSKVPYGTYYITETDLDATLTAKGYVKGDIYVNGTKITPTTVITVGPNDPLTTVKAENDILFGKITAQKWFWGPDNTKLPTAPADAPATFELKLVGKTYGKTYTITVNKDGTVTAPTNVRFDTYTVTETVPAGWECKGLSLKIGTSSGQLVDNGKLEVVVDKNSYTKALLITAVNKAVESDISVSKVLNNSTLIDGSDDVYFPISIVNTVYPNIKYVVQLQNGDSSPSGISLPPGTYTVSEDLTGTALAGYELKSIVITEDGVPLTTPNNTFKIKYGKKYAITVTNDVSTRSVYVKKNLENTSLLNPTLAAEPYIIYLQRDGNADPFELSIDPNTGKSTALPFGTYTVSEDLTQDQIDAGIFNESIAISVNNTVLPPGSTFTVDASTLNYSEANKTGIKVQVNNIVKTANSITGAKNLTDVKGTYKDKEFTITITNNDNTISPAITETVTVKPSATSGQTGTAVAFTKAFPAGTYTIKEVLSQADKEAGISLTSIKVNGTDYTPNADGEITFTLTKDMILSTRAFDVVAYNSVAYLPGEKVTVHKDLIGPDGNPLYSGVLNFTVNATPSTGTGYSINNVQALTATNTYNFGTANFDLGEWTITETPPGANDKWELVSITVNGTEYLAGTTAKMTISNATSNKTIVVKNRIKAGTITFAKDFRDAAGDPYDPTTLIPSANTEAFTVRLTDKDTGDVYDTAVSKSGTVEKAIPVGTYDIEEILTSGQVNAGYIKRPVLVDGVAATEITISDNATAEITAVNDIITGSLTATKTKIVDKNDVEIPDDKTSFPVTLYSGKQTDVQPTGFPKNGNIAVGTPQIFDGLVPGEYTLVETPGSGYSVVGSESRTINLVVFEGLVLVDYEGSDSPAFTNKNTSAYGEIIVNKEVLDIDNEVINDTHTFYVKVTKTTGDYTDTKPFSVGSPATFSDLTYGSYEVEEVAPGDPYDVLTSKTTVTIGGGQSTSIDMTIKNRNKTADGYIDVNKLGFEKYGTGPDAQLFSVILPGEFEVELHRVLADGTRKPYGSRMLTTSGPALSFTGLPDGNYIVSETVASQKDYAVTVTSGGSLRVINGVPELPLVTVSNIIEYETFGSITVEKKGVGNVPYGPYTILLEGTAFGTGDKISLSGEVTLGNTVTFPKLQYGEYQLSESVDGSFKAPIFDNDGKVTLTSSSAFATVNVTNELKPKGSITIDKTVVGQGSEVYSGRFEFLLECEALAYSQTFTLDVTNGVGSRTIGNLEPGEYKISEINVPIAFDASVDIDTVTIDYGSQETVNAVNKFKTGRIEVFKTNESEEPLAGATFLLTGPNEYSKTLVSDENGIISFDNLMPGTYTLSEISAPDGYKTTTETWTFVVSPESETTLFHRETIMNEPDDLNPGIDVVKLINGAHTTTATRLQVEPGTVLRFTFTVTNTGDVPLTNVTVVDNVLGAITAPGFDGTLDPKESYTFTVTYRALLAGELHDNTVTAKGNDGEKDVTDTDTAHARATVPTIPDPPDPDPPRPGPSPSYDPTPTISEAPAVTIAPQITPQGTPTITDLPIEDLPQGPAQVVEVLPDDIVPLGAKENPKTGESNAMAGAMIILVAAGLGLLMLRRKDYTN